MSEEEKVNTALSYSSSTLLNNCEERYCHYKVHNTPKDSDFSEDYSAFDIGKTYHDVLENSMHKRENIDALLDTACKEYKTEEDKLMIKAMVHKYLDLHEASGLTCIKCELQISSKEMIGFVDAFMEDKKGYWYICDLKTAGMWKESILSRLASDYQLNLYSHFAKLLGSVLSLDPAKFKGTLYRVTTKTKISQKGTESDSAFYNRLYKTVRSFDVFVPVSSMCIEETWSRHLEAYNRSIQLREGVAPTRNYNYCESYFRPCPYWSNCHGDIYTNCKNRVILNTATTFNNNNKNILEVL